MFAIGPSSLVFLFETLFFNFCTPRINFSSYAIYLVLNLFWTETFFVQNLLMSTSFFFTFDFSKVSNYSVFILLLAMSWYPSFGPCSLVLASSTYFCTLRSAASSLPSHPSLAYAVSVSPPAVISPLACSDPLLLSSAVPAALYATPTLH